MKLKAAVHLSFSFIIYLCASNIIIYEREGEREQKGYTGTHSYPIT